VTRRSLVVWCVLMLAGCDSLFGRGDDGGKNGQPAEPAPPPTPPGIHGTVQVGDQAAAGLMVTAKATSNGIETTVFTGPDGSFDIEGLPAGAYQVRGHYPGHVPASSQVDITTDAGAQVALSLAQGDRTHSVPTSAWLAKLPDGDTRRELILNCGTCHGMTADRVTPEGAPRDEAGWAEVIAKMREMDVYEVIPPDFDDAAYSKWLAEHFAADKVAEVSAPAPMDPRRVANLVITEYPIPHAETELPHDLVVGPDRRVWVTGFWTGEIWAIDPATGETETFDVYENRDPEVPAQTRALEFDDAGILWMINGGQNAVVRLDPETKEIRTFDVGMYAHDIVLDSRGHPWFNDYFAKSERIGHLDPESGQVETFELPAPERSPEEGVPLPYGLMIDAKDRLFSTQLAGNTLVRFDIATKQPKLYTMPDPNVGPRRTAIHPDGSLWIPEYNTGRITRFDPERETFETIDLGVTTAGPYDADINGTSGEIWVSGSLDTSMFLVDAATKSSTRFQLPTEPALIRHIAVDEDTGDVWVAYSSLPTAAPKVARLHFERGPATAAR